MLTSNVLLPIMIMTPLKHLSTLFFVLLMAVFSSCSTMIDGTVREGGAAEIDIDTSLKPRTVAVINSIRSFLGGAAGTPIMDGAAISQSIAAAPGVLTVSLTNSSPTAMDGSFSISNVGDFLAIGDAQGQFITFTEGQGAGTSSIIVNVDRYSAPALIARLSPELEGYLSALMAPVILGERMTRQAYLNLIAMVYGRALADEIAAARVRASIQFPRPLTAVHGGTAAGNRADFDIPLVDLLVMEHPLRYEVSW